jgi:hypothetical protein
MSEDTPRPKRSPTERGLHANTGNDASLASYVSSALYLLSVPTLILLAYGGFWAGLYPYELVIPAFGGLVVALVALLFGVMHLATGR